MNSTALLRKGDKLNALDPVDGNTSTLVVNGEPWFNTADMQWYYPIEDVDDKLQQGDITDSDISSGTVTRIV